MPEFYGLWPMTRRLPRSPLPMSQRRAPKSPPFHVTRLLASRLWTSSLLGRTLTIHNIRSIISYVSLFFVLDLPLSVPLFPPFPKPSYHRTLPHILHYRRLRARYRAPYSDSVNVLFIYYGPSTSSQDNYFRLRSPIFTLPLFSTYT